MGDCVVSQEHDVIFCAIFCAFVRWSECVVVVVVVVVVVPVSDNSDNELFSWMFPKMKRNCKQIQTDDVSFFNG